MSGAFVPAAASGKFVGNRRSVTVERTATVYQRSETICLAENSPSKQSFWKRTGEGLAAASLGLALALGPGFTVDHFAAQAVQRATTNGGGTFKSASGRVNKDPESLLRWSLPINNKQVRELQADLEEITYDIRASKWNNIEGDVRKATATVNKKSEAILASVGEAKKADAAQLLERITGRLGELKDLVQLRNGEDVIALQRDILRDVGRVEQAMISEFPYSVPEEYKDLPQLKGRAVVEMKLKKANDEKFDIDGTLYDTAKMTMVIDGYSAPITGGNFVDLVRRGFYNKMEVSRSDGFVVQAGDPAGDADGFIDPKTEKIRSIPLEIFSRNDKLPTYGTTLEDEGRATEATVLPFTSYGTMAFAREEFNADSGSSQFFWFLFEPDLTPAGRNLLDGRYAVFGYTVQGEFFLRDVKAGDIITEAKVTAGLENLVAPKDVVDYKGANLERG